MPRRAEPKTASTRVGLTSADLFDFDEAGSASRSDLRMARITPVAPVRPEDVLTLIGRVRWPGNPPIARAVAAALAEHGLPLTELTDGHSQGSDRWHAIAHQGIDGKVGEFDVLVGTADFLEDAGIPISEAIRTLLDEHESQGWRPVLVGACRSGQGPKNVRRSLIGVLSFETRSTVPAPGRSEAGSPPQAEPLVGDRLSVRVAIFWHRAVQRIAGLFTRRRLYIAGLVLASGLAGLWFSLLTVGSDELAVVQRFGRAVTLLGPGLHVRPWWPFEIVTRLQPRAVRTVAIGPEPPAATADAEEPAGELMSTGDVWPGESGASQAEPAAADLGGSRSVPQLLRVRARVQYGIAAPAAFLFNTRDPDGLVASTAGAVLRALIASRSASACLGSGRTAIADRAAKLVQEKLDAMDCGVAIDAVILDDLQPSAGDADLKARDLVSDRIEAGIFSQAESDRLIAETRRQSLDVMAVAEKGHDRRVREARWLLEEVRANAADYARDPEGTRRRLLFDLANDLPGGLSQLRGILAQTMSPGRRPVATQEGGTR